MTDSLLEDNSDGPRKQPSVQASTEQVEGVVIRPGFVYGGKSAEMAGWLAPNDKGAWVLDGDASKSWSWVHIQDLARLYVSVVDAASSVVKGEIFNAADSTRVTYGEMRTALARAAGFQGELVKADRGTDFFSTISDATTVISSQKAAKLLGWVPVLGPLQDRYQSIVTAFRANQTAKK